MKKFDLNFRLVLISKVISVIGGNILAFALILFLVDFTQSAGALGVVTAISQAPIVLLSPLGGVIADRLSKKKLIILFDLLQGVNCLILLFLLWSEAYSVVTIGGLRVLFTSIAVLVGPVFTASIPRIVKEDVLVDANGAIQSIQAIGLIGGSALGGILYSILGIQRIVMFSLVFFTVSTIINLFIKIPFEKREMQAGFAKAIVGDVREGFHFVRKEKPIILKMVMFASMVSFMLPPIFNIGTPFIVSLIFQQNVGVTFGIASLGMLLGGIVSGKIKSLLTLKYYHRWVAGLGVSGMLLSLALSPFILGNSVLAAFWLFNFTLFGILLTISFTNVLFGVKIQKETPEHLLGKVNALNITLGNIATPLGALAVGFLIETMENYLHILFLGVAILLFVISLAARKVLASGFEQEKEALLEEAI